MISVFILEHLGERNSKETSSECHQEESGWHAVPAAAKCGREKRQVSDLPTVSRHHITVITRLRDLLSREEEQYMTEIASKQETSLERQAKMRERAKQLKESREHERKALVGDKLEQRWRQQCEEMRGLMSKRTQDAVCTERREQLRLQAERKERERQEDNMYAKLWDEDYRIKCRREEIETTLQIERNREALKVL